MVKNADVLVDPHAKEGQSAFRLISLVNNHYDRRMREGRIDPEELIELVL
jgi:hypothetical protein